MNDSANQESDEPQIYRISVLDRVTFHGVYYRLANTDENAHHLVTVADPPRFQEFRHGRFQRLLQSEAITVEKEYFSEENAQVRSVWQDVTLSDLPTEKRSVALFYADFINEFMRMRRDNPKSVNLSQSSLERVLPEIDERLKQASGKKRSGKRSDGFNPPQPRNFRRLYRKYAEAGYQAIALAPQEPRRRVRIPPFAAHDLQFWNEYATKYAGDKQPTMAALLRNLTAEAKKRNPDRLARGLPPLTIPKRKYFEKLVRSLNPFFVTAAREGVKAAREKFRITYRGLEVERPLERVEMDEWRVDLSVILADLRTWERLSKAEQKAVKRSRLWLTVAIDSATRNILAMKFSDRAPNGLSALAALEMAMMDKTLLSYVVGTGMPWLAHGEFEQLWADQGPGFRSTAFRTAVSELGIAFSHPPAGTPALRPFIESVFKTISTQFMQWFDGRTFSNYLEKGDYDPQENATVCVDELNRHLVRAIVDIYHQSPHHGLAFETPHNAWLRLSRKYGVLPPPDSDRRRHVFGINLQRKIGDKGIHFLGLHYNSGDLQALRVSQGVGTVKVRVNRFDIGRLSVWNGQGWLTIDTNHDFPADVSIWEWIGAARELEATHDRNARRGLSAMFAAINHLRESGEAAYARSEFAVPKPGASDIMAAEKRHFRGIQFVDDRKKSERAPLAPMTGTEILPPDAPSVFPYQFKQTDEDEFEQDPTGDLETVDDHESENNFMSSHQSQFGDVKALKFED